MKINRVLINQTKNWKQSMKKVVFSHSKISIDKNPYIPITSKNFDNYYIRYKLNHNAKKSIQHIQNLIRKLEQMKEKDEMDEKTTREVLSKAIVKLAKLYDENDGMKFLLENCNKQNAKNTFMLMINEDIDIIIEFDAYIMAGLIAVLQLLDQAKRIAFELINEYGKEKANYILKNEMHKVLHEKLKPENDWKIGAFMEYIYIYYRVCFDKPRKKGLGKSELGTLLINEPLLQELLEN